MEERNSWKVVLVLCGLTLLPFVALLPFNDPTADDFTIANRVAREGLGGAVAETYETWSGRYVSFPLASLLIRVGGFGWLYRALPVFLFALMGTAFWSLLRALFPTELTRGQAAAAAAILNVAYLVWLHSTASAYYWLAGSVTYTLGQAFALFLIALLVRGGSKTACVLLVALIVGCNEVHMLWIVLALLALSVRPGPRRRFHASLLAVAIAGTLVVMLAPGNTVRYAQHPQGGDFLHSVGRAATMPFGLLLRWMLSPAVLGITALSLPFLSRVAQGRGSRFRPRHVVLVWLVLMFTGFFVSYWSQGHKPPRRILNTLYLAHLLLWFGFVYAWLAGRAGPFVLARRTAVLAVVTVAIGLFGVGQTPFAMYDVAVNAWPYREQMDEWHRLTKEQLEAGKRDIELPALTHVPRTVIFEPLAPDSLAWYPRAYAQHIGADSVTIVDD
jgi:hypothetical protein